MHRRSGFSASGPTGRGSLAVCAGLALCLLASSAGAQLTAPGRRVPALVAPKAAPFRQLAPQRATVPDLYGMHVGAAGEALTHAGLQIEGGTNPRDEFSCVTSQDPPAGARVAPGTVVSVQVAQNCPDRVSVPSLIGRPQHDAEFSLRSTNLMVGQVRTVASDQAAGTVTGQNPAPGVLVLPGSQVSLDLSQGPQAVPPRDTLPQRGLVSVPNVFGMGIEQAKAAVRSSGLRDATPILRQESGLTAGTIITQQPAAGTAVKRGSSVTLTAALASPRVAVPDVTQHGAEDARAMVLAAGLRVGNVIARPSAATPGLVIAQDPPGGRSVKRGSLIDLTVARMQTVLVPQLRGITLERARALLGKRGLALGALTPLAPDSTESVVTLQDPVAGRRVPKGRPVDLTFGPRSIRALVWIADTTATVGDTVAVEVRVTPPQSGATYRIDFGEGPPSPWLERPRTRHVYTRAGEYRVRAEVRLADGAVLRPRALPLHVRSHPWPIAAAVVVVGGAAGLLAHQLWPRPRIGFALRMGDPLRVTADVGPSPGWSLALITPGTLQTSTLQPALLRATVVRRLA